MQLLYLVGFSLSQQAGRNIGTLNKYRELRKSIKQVDLLDLSCAVLFRAADKSRCPRMLAKALGFIELNVVVLVKGVFGRRWDTVIVRDFLLFSRRLLMSRGTRLVVEVHADIEEEVKLTKASYWRVVLPFYLWFLNRQIKGADGVIFNHPLLEKYLKRRLQIVAPTLSAYNGADTDSFRPMEKAHCRKRLGIPLEKMVLVFVGNVSIWHGVELLLGSFVELCKLNPDVVLYVVGGAEDGHLGRIKERFRTVDRVVFTGRVSRNASMYYMNAADACMLPVNDIRVSPGSPIKLYDYIACGKPVITQSGTLGYSDVVCTHNLGVVVDFRDGASAARHIQHYLEKIGQEGPSLNSQIRSVAEQHLSWNAVVGEWIGFIEKLQDAAPTV